MIASRVARVNWRRAASFDDRASADDAKYFFSDSSSCHVEYVNGELCLVDGTSPVVPESYNDPEGNEIMDPVVVEWLSENGFTQADIDALGGDSAATDKL